MQHTPIRSIVSSHDVCGEGAIWYPQQDAVFWTDINRHLLHRYTRGSGAFDTWQFDQPVTAVTLTSDEYLILIVLGGRIVLWSLPLEKTVSTLFTLPEWPSVRCNDARVAPNGALWFGTMENNVRPDGTTGEVKEWVGQLYSLTADSDAKSWWSGLGIANTVAWSPDGETMYFGDTLRNCLYRCAFDAGRNEIENSVIFQEGFARGLPDGSAVDQEGHLWNCRYGGTCIIRIAPDGSVVHVLDTPVKNPTTCTFGGPDLRTLFFTSAGGDQATNDGDPGSLFSLEMEIPGLPTTPFLL
jgi:sugar lactone lactonase YvrE